MKNRSKITIIILLAICFGYVGYTMFKGTFSVEDIIYNPTIEDIIISKSASNTRLTSQGVELSELRESINSNAPSGDTYGFQDNEKYKYLLIRNYDYAKFSEYNNIKSGIKKVSNRYYDIDPGKEFDICDIKLCLAFNTNKVNIEIDSKDYQDLRLKFSYIYRGTDIEIVRFNSAEIYVYVDNGDEDKGYIGPFLIDDYEQTLFINRDQSGTDIYKEGNQGYVYNIVSENLLNNEKIKEDSIITNILLVPYSRYDEYESKSSFNITELSLVGYKNGNYHKKTYEKMTVDETVIREKIVSNMIKNATLKWSPSEDFTYIESETKSFDFKSNSSYYGLPYFDAIDATRNSFLNQIDNKKYIVPKNNNGEFEQEKLRGLYCSSSVYEAVSESLPMHTDLGWTKPYLTSPEIKLLGNLTYNYGETGDKLNTSNVKNKYSKEDFYYAYSQLQIGDGIIHFTDYIESGICKEQNSVTATGFTYNYPLYNKGHVMVISGKTVLKDSNGNKLTKYEVGKVDPDKSYVVATEIINNTGNTTKTYSIIDHTSFKEKPNSDELEQNKYFDSKYTDLNNLKDIEGKYTQWNIHRKISFSDLYIGLQCSSYLPFTYTNYGDEIEKPYATLINNNTTKESIEEENGIEIKGTINTNYTIQEIEYIVTGYNKNTDGSYTREYKSIETEYPDSTMIYSLTYQTNNEIKNEIASTIQNYDLYDINVAVKLGNKINNTSVKYSEIEAEEIIVPILKSDYYFDDMNLYQCVVDSYNNENDENISTSGRLNESQLLTIKELDCSNKNITSTKGIEKLTNIKKINLSNNELTELDLSNNISLEELYLNKNKLETINLNQNQNLVLLDISNNNITTLVVNNNPNLTHLYTYNNNIKSIDLNQNTSLNKLYLSNNQLSNLDLSNNLSITEAEIYKNPYNEIIYVYKGNNIAIGNNIKLPEQLNWRKPTWTSKNTNIATVNNDGLITTLKSGNVEIIGNAEDKYLTISNINVVEITSNEYVINENDNYIVIYNDNDIETIKNNIEVSHNEVNLNIDVENNKLQIKYNDEILKEYNLKKEITDNYFEIDSEYNLDNQNSVISNVPSKTTGDKLIEKIRTNGNISLFDKNDNEINLSEVLKTGDKLKVTYNNNPVFYSISIVGDANGDGRVSLLDLSQIRKHIAGVIDETTGEVYQKQGIYFSAIDINNDGKVSLMDLSKMRKLIVGESINT